MPKSIHNSLSRRLRGLRSIPGASLARLAGLHDQLALPVGGPVEVLPAAFHEVVAVGAMRSPEDECTALVTVVTSDDESHVFALDLGLATELRAELARLRDLNCAAIATRPA